MKNDDKKTTNTNLPFNQIGQQIFDPYANFEIAGMPEHNQQVRENRANRLNQQSNLLALQQLQAINFNLQTQIDDARKSSTEANQLSAKANILSDEANQISKQANNLSDKANKISQKAKSISIGALIISIASVIASVLIAVFL